MQNPFRSFVIVNMGTVGYGVFFENSSKNPITIKASTPLWIYAGEIVLEPPKQKNSVRNGYLYRIKDSSLATDAKTTGGIARFVQHLPADGDAMQTFCHAYYGEITPKLAISINNTIANDPDPNLDNILFNGPHRKKVARANIVICNEELNGYPLTVFYAAKDIILQPGQRTLAGYGYANDYWQAAARYPELFFPDGRQLTFEEYQRPRACAHTHTLTGTRQISGLNYNMAHWPAFFEKNKFKAYCGVTPTEVGNEELRLSIFKARRRFSQAKMIDPARYDELPVDDNLAEVIELLKQANLNVHPRRYYLNPEFDITHAEANKLCLVLSAKTENDFNNLRQAIDPLKQWIYLELTYEVVVEEQDFSVLIERLKALISLEKPSCLSPNM
jgi:hypothetical protein